MSRLFFGGIPTQMDVDRLIKEVDAKAGMKVSYDDVERILGLNHHENRFRTVTGAWRKRLFRERFLQSTADGEAFHFLNADEAHDHGRLSLARVGRATGRLHVRVRAINANELTTNERRERQKLLERETQAMVDAARQSVKAIAAPKPVNAPSIRIAK